MRFYLLFPIFLLLRAAAPVFGQITPLVQVGTEPGSLPPPLTYAEEMPAYPGGDAALHQYLATRTEYPEAARRQGLSGTVVVQFVVDETGRLLDPQVVKTSEPAFDTEAIRLVRLMPWWTPGRQQGQLVRVRCTLPIRFTFKR